MTYKQKAYIDNKVVIKVKYKDLETYMSWKAIVKLTKLGRNVYFPNITDVKHYWSIKEGWDYVRRDIK